MFHSMMQQISDPFKGKCIMHSASPLIFSICKLYLAKAKANNVYRINSRLNILYLDFTLVKAKEIEKLQVEHFVPVFLQIVLIQ